MISYTLKCAQGHQFNSWFSSAAAYDALAQAGHLSCAVCGSGSVEKSLMAPRVSTADAAAPAPQAVDAPLSVPHTKEEQALAQLRQKVEENSDYVGADFATQARAMHAGEAPERAIYGEAGPEQAKALVEEGVPVLPLPFRPKRKLS